jgi:ATP-dependent helicase/nuclease subunit A
MMHNDLLIPDRAARESAETTFDRNVVVVAGAGTGKTTLLVNRLVHLLMKAPAPVSITQVVALTFTNKAATEMKVRLRERLTLLALARIGKSADRHTP